VVAGVAHFQEQLVLLVLAVEMEAMLLEIMQL
jgi:hypothetical protein